jgi:hypothetical protein
MKTISCKNEDEVTAIITELKNENSNLSEELILKAISSCCLDCSTKEHDDFMECVKERIRILSLMK